MPPRVLVGGLPPLLRDLVVEALEGTTLVEELVQCADDEGAPSDAAAGPTIVITAAEPGRERERVRALLRHHPDASVLLLTDDSARAALHELWPQLIDTVENPGSEALRGVVARATPFGQREEPE